MDAFGGHGDASEIAGDDRGVEAAWKSCIAITLKGHKAETPRLDRGRLRLTVPTIIFWGKDDRTALLPQGVALFITIAEHNKLTCGWSMMANARHYLYREYPDEWNAYVIDYCKRFGR